MSRRRRTENPVSLFPFVAVMASTMGALILLLLVTARQASKARDAAWLESQRAAAPLPKLPPLPGKAEFPELPPLPPYELPRLVERVIPSLPPLTDPRSAILARREQIERELAELRKKRERTPKAGEERLAPLMREAALLRSRLERILDDRRRMQVKLKDSISQADELASEKDRAAERRRQSPNKYAVTPYFGPNATSRRPIYLECTKEAVILRPEGVSVPTAKLEADARADNPLARLVHAVSDHWMKRDPDPPYPLLIVRPDGVHSYYVARTALEFLRYPFGYELVAAERELAYPPADEHVRKLATAALVETAQPRRFAGVPNGGGGDAPTKNGGTDNDGPTPGGNGRGGAGAPSTSPGTTSSSNEGGVVAAIVPPEPEPPAAEPAEIGASVRDYIARRQGPSGNTPGLGTLAAESPTPFENPGAAAAANRRGGVRSPRDRTQANAGAELQRPQPTLSQRLQEMVQESPIPLPSARPQTQQWQPGLDGLDRNPVQRNDADASAPPGAWSASQGVNHSPKNENEQPAAPSRRITSLGEQLWMTANARPSASGEKDPYAVGPGRMDFIERLVRCEVRAGSIITADGRTVLLESDAEADAAAQAAAASCFAAVREWGDPPAGRLWRPYILLLVRSGGAENSYRLRGALAAAGISVKQLWVDDHGVPTLVPVWGR
jgi:hypothetical protein